jgi:hypothetical protein
MRPHVLPTPTRTLLLLLLLLIIIHLQLLQQQCLLLLCICVPHADVPEGLLQLDRRHKSDVGAIQLLHTDTTTATVAAMHLRRHGRC